MSRHSVVTCLPRCGSSRNERGPASPTRSSLPPATRCSARRSGAVDPLGRADRWARPLLLALARRRGAARSSSMLRADCAQSRTPSRPDGVAVASALPSCSRASTRCRRGVRRPRRSRVLSHDPDAPRRAAAGAVAAVAGRPGSPQPADSLCPVVDGWRRRRRRAGHRLQRVSHHAGQPGGAYAALAGIGTDDFAPRAAAPPLGPSLKQLLAPRSRPAR